MSSAQNANGTRLFTTNSDFPTKVDYFFNDGITASYVETLDVHSTVSDLHCSQDTAYYVAVGDTSTNTVIIYRNSETSSVLVGSYANNPVTISRPSNDNYLFGYSVNLSNVDPDGTAPSENSYLTVLSAGTTESIVYIYFYNSISGWIITGREFISVGTDNSSDLNVTMSGNGTTTVSSSTEDEIQVIDVTNEAIIIGDPHIITIKGVQYDLCFNGEWKLLLTDHEEFEFWGKGFIKKAPRMNKFSIKNTLPREMELTEMIKIKWNNVWHFVDLRGRVNGLFTVPDPEGDINAQIDSKEYTLMSSEYKKFTTIGSVGVLKKVELQTYNNGLHLTNSNKLSLYSPTNCVSLVWNQKGSQFGVKISNKSKTYDGALVTPPQP